MSAIVYKLLKQIVMLSIFICGVVCIFKGMYEEKIDLFVVSLTMSLT